MLPKIIPNVRQFSAIIALALLVQSSQALGPAGVWFQNALQMGKNLQVLMFFVHHLHIKTIVWMSVGISSQCVPNWTLNTGAQTCPSTSPSQEGESSPPVLGARPGSISDYCFCLKLLPNLVPSLVVSPPPYSPMPLTIAPASALVLRTDSSHLPFGCLLLPLLLSTGLFST